MANTSGQTLGERVLQRFGGFAIATFGAEVTDALNDAIVVHATGSLAAQYPSVQSLAEHTIEVTAATSGIQRVALSNWADDIFAPLTFYDLTNDRPLTVDNLDGEGLDFGSQAQTPGSEIARYALWGENLEIIPTLDTPATIQLRYLAIPTALIWDGSAISGDSPFPQQLDAGLKLWAQMLLAPTLNPGLEVIFERQYTRWLKRHVPSRIFSRTKQRHGIRPNARWLQSTGVE